MKTLGQIEIRHEHRESFTFTDSNREMFTCLSIQVEMRNLSSKYVRIIIFSLEETQQLLNLGNKWLFSQVC